MNVQEAISKATFYTDSVEYSLLKLHPRAITLAAGIIAEVGDPFCALLVDKDETTLLIPSHLVAEFTRLRDYETSTLNYRLITIDIELPPDLIGFMAVISKALAEAHISILPFAAFSRDHIMVPAEQLTTAIDTLKALQAGYK